MESHTARQVSIVSSRSSLAPLALVKSSACDSMKWSLVFTDRHQGPDGRCARREDQAPLHRVAGRRLHQGQGGKGAAAGDDGDLPRRVRLHRGDVPRERVADRHVQAPSLPRL
eukprot:CAMPEP_0180386844 /NCGR_PEP_ID=MMETSP0989-20121125/29880_1 /TAXON_ID=697907 /ORGANISM="non described non described, Strain CCMP2293" /LENGTH=112 /DNA_ID=CAMNT_0022387583 /DNA_START=301 /DNA_END=639 /DNA_ORIENTATION=+